MKRIVRATAMALAVGSTVVLSACGQATTAATVGGTTITEDEVNSAVQQINSGLQLQQPLTPDLALTMLIAAPTFLDYGTQHGIVVNESQIRASMPIKDPSPATVQVLRFNQAASQMSQEQQQQAVDELAKLKVTVNPKYGDFNPAQMSVSPAQPNWLTAPAG